MIDRFKQHLLLPLLGVAVGTLVWQLYLLSTATSATEMPKESTLKPVALNQPSHITPIEQHTTNLAETRELSAKQLQYLQLVNELRITQVKKLIAQDNEAIALSQQHVQKTNSALGQIEPPKSKTTTESSAVVATPAHAQQEEGVKLVYTGEQNGIWNATINVQGRLYDVVKGTKLPSGDTVANIDQDVVILSQGPWKKVLSFYDMTRYYQPSQDVQSRDAQAAVKVEQPIVKAEVKVSTPVVAKVETKVIKPVVAKVEAKVTAPVVAKVETKVTAPVVAKVETKVTAPVVAKVEAKVTAPVVAKVETKVPAPVAAKVQSKISVPIVAVKATSKPVMQVAHTTTEKTTLLIAKPAEDDTNVPSLLMKPHGATPVVAKVEVKKPVVEIAKKEVVIAKVEPVKKSVTQVAAKKPVVEIPVKVIAMIGETKKPAPAKPVALRHYNDVERQLLLQDPKQYTLQVFSGDDLASVQKFINQNNLAGKTKVYTRYQNNHPQHIVVIEHFKTAEEAMEGLTKLPIELHQFAPEIKSLASVQQELKTVS